MKMNNVYSRSLPRKVVLAASFWLVAGLSAGLQAHESHECTFEFHDEPALKKHINQTDIGNDLGFRKVSKAGELIFGSRFNVCDGQGRPATTGAGEKRHPNQPAKLRTSGPDADSCAGCHNQPRIGGSGDFVANVFVLAQAADPVILSISPEFSNERNTLGMNGSGAIEMLAREMTVELQLQASKLSEGDHTLSAKGVQFDVSISDGKVVASRGVDTDLIIKPFHQAGVVTSLRQFTTNAMNHHHGMQAEERFDLNPTKGFDPDFDGDGVQRELTVGDITAATIWQAQLGVPGRIRSNGRAERNEVKLGETIFNEVGCGSCHVPKMVLERRLFTEPNPFNPPGTCSDETVCPGFSYDMTKRGEGPLLEKGKKGTAIVRAYTDLKRHNLCDDHDEPDAIRFFCNEQLAQGRPEQDGKPGAEFFLTRKLWDVGNSAPYGHRGDVSTIFEAILYHGGEARFVRDAYTRRSGQEQKAVVKFLKTLQVLPPGKLARTD